MRLWTEHAWRTAGGEEVPAAGVAVSTLTTEDRFAAVLVSGWEPAVRSLAADVAERLAQQTTSELATGKPLDAVVGEVLAVLPAGEHLAVGMLRIGRDGQAALAEIDAPPLFMARRGDVLFLPVAEEEVGGRLVRRCDFTVQPDDHLAMVSAGFIRPRRAGRPWNWREAAFSVRRLTATGCDAEQLAEALMRLASGSQLPVAVLAMFARPMRTATVWSGPPADRRRDQEALNRLLAEPGTRIICGDTTAEIVARLLGGRLIMEPRPANGWREVPPASRLIAADGTEPVALITEGVVTMRVALERLGQVTRPQELAGRSDGASRLARLLLTADEIRFLVGLAVNLAQTERDGTPLRKAAVARLAGALQARGKIVVVEYW